MPDYAKKARVISSGLLKEYKRIKRAEYAEYVKYDTGEKINCDMDIVTAEEQRFFYSHFAPEDWKECKRVFDSNRQQTARLKKRIEQMIAYSPDCVFVTLTFRDDVLASTSSETRRQYVRKFLKANSSRYVANIDFGGKNGREHYHAVSDTRLNPKLWKYGALNVKKVRYDPESKSSVRLAKYVAKLTNHAIKDTTKRCALIYSRNFLSR